MVYIRRRGVATYAMRAIAAVEAQDVTVAVHRCYIGLTYPLGVL